MKKTSPTLGNYGYWFISRLTLGLFILLSLAEVVFEVFSLGFASRLIKCVLVPLLMINALSLIVRDGGDRNAALAVSGAMILHTAGDFLLELSEGFFMWGLVAFLAGNVIFLAYFIRCVGKQHFPGNMVWIIAGVIAVLVSLWIAPGNEMILPVALYSLSLLCYLSVGTAGLFEYFKSLSKGEETCALRKPAFILILFGGLLFILSDSLLALSVFKGVHVRFGGALIMATYLGAEFLLSRGAWKLSLCPEVPPEDYGEEKDGENFDE